MKESNINSIKHRPNDRDFKEAMIRKNCLASCNSWNHDWNDYMKAVDNVDNYFRDYYNDHVIRENGKFVSAPTYEEVLIATIEHFKDSFIHQCVINDIL